MKEADVIDHVLRRIYHSERVISKRFTRIKRWHYQMEFQFPQQNKSLSPGDHVSNSHVAEAVTESLYASTAFAIDQDEINLGFTVEEFVLSKGDFYLRQLNMKFLRLLKPSQTYTFDIYIQKIQEREGYNEVSYALKGNVFVKVNALFPIEA